MDTSQATIAGLITVIILTLTLTLPGDKGLISVCKMHHEMSVMSHKNVELQTQNHQLAKKAQLLRNNSNYIEHVIIKEMNMVRPSDIVIILKSKKN